MDSPPQPESPEITPGQRTTEFGSLVGLAGLLPFLKDQPPTVIICLTVTVCVYMSTRAWLKGRT